MFNVSRTHFISIHFGFSFRRSNFLWSFPFNNWHIHCIFRWRLRIIIKGCFICWEFRISKKRIIFSTNFNNFVNFVFNRILLLSLLMHVHLILVMHHFLTVLILFFSVVVLLLSSQHLLVLFLSKWHSILSNKLAWIVLTAHHLLLLKLNELINKRNYLLLDTTVIHRVIASKLAVILETFS